MAEKTAWEERGAQYFVNRATYDGVLDQSALMRWAEGVLDRFGQVRYLHAALVSEASSRCVYGPKPFHLLFSEWLHVRRRCLDLNLSSAEVIRIGDASIIRMRVGNERRSIVASNSRNPLQLGAYGSSSAALAHITHIGYPRSIGIAGDKRITLFAKSNAALPDLLKVARSAHAEALSRFPFTGINLYVRRDDWFIDDPYYPFVNPFEETGAGPTSIEDYRGRAQASCLAGERGGCRGLNLSGESLPKR